MGSAQGLPMTGSSGSSFAFLMHYMRRGITYGMNRERERERERETETETDRQTDRQTDRENVFECGM